MNLVCFPVSSALMHSIQTAWAHFCMIPHAIHASTQYAFSFDRKTIHTYLLTQSYLATNYMAHYCLHFVLKYIFIVRMVVCLCSQKCTQSMVCELFNASAGCWAPDLGSTRGQGSTIHTFCVPGGNSKHHEFYEQKNSAEQLQTRCRRQGER